MVEINNPILLYKYMKENISYGFMSKYGTKFLREDSDENKYMENIFKNYCYQSPDEVFINRCGICFDQVEFAKTILANNGYDVKTYYTKIHNHVFLVIKYNDKYYYFERSFPNNNGIFIFDSLKDLFEYYLSIQKNNKLNEVEFYEFDNINYGIGFYDYIDNIKKQNNIQMVLKKEIK